MLIILIDKWQLHLYLYLLIQIYFVTLFYNEYPYLFDEWSINKLVNLTEMIFWYTKISKHDNMQQ